MERNVGTVGKFDYSYREYIGTWFMKKFSCCCKRLKTYKDNLKRYENYEAAEEKLITELDFVRVLNVIRLSEFLSILTLKKYQRVSMSQFRRY